MSNIIFAVDEEVKMLNCKKNSKKGCNNKLTKCITHDLWDQLDHHINIFFEKVKLQDLVNKIQNKLFMKNQDINYNKDYKYGFTTDIENIKAPKGLTEETIKFISKIKNEPKWMLEWRLKAFNRLKVSKEPNWQKPKYPKINYQDLYYYSVPKSMKDKPKNLSEVDPVNRNI